MKKQQCTFTQINNGGTGYQFVNSGNMTLTTTTIVAPISSRPLNNGNTMTTSDDSDSKDLIQLTKACYYDRIDKLTDGLTRIREDDRIYLFLIDFMSIITKKTMLSKEELLQEAEKIVASQFTADDH